MNISIIRKLLARCSVAGLLVLAGVAPMAASAVGGAPAEQTEPEKGPNNGKLLRKGDFALELALYERGVPPEYRVWVTDGGKAVAPSEVDLRVRLTRLGGVDDIGFAPEGDYLRGDTMIYEPHSFVVHIEARYRGETYEWEYDNFEGRTQIKDEVANAMGILTAPVGGATLRRSIPAYGRLVAAPGARRDIRARFDGQVRALHVALGDRVQKGQRLVTVESDQSLQRYAIDAPMDGVVARLDVAEGEHTAGRSLLVLLDPAALQAELAIYPKDWERVRRDAPVSLRMNGVAQAVAGRVAGADAFAGSNQARTVRVPVDNTAGALAEGLFVAAEIEVARFDVPLAVRRDALQAFRDFTVVYAKFGDTYEVRMLELGREGRDWVEVLGGIEPGTEYVTTNSYIIKADIEKSGAAHDH